MRFKINIKSLVVGAVLLAAGAVALLERPLSVQAENFLAVRMADYPLAEDYQAVSPEGAVRLKLAAGALNSRLFFKLMSLTDSASIGNFFTYDESLQPLSDLYFIKFEPTEVEPLFNVQPQVVLKYQPGDRYQELYYYSWEDLRFKKMETARNVDARTLAFDWPAGQTSLMFAIFGEAETSGLASWYVHGKYVGQLIAASVDWAQGSQVKVTNLDNDKSVVVTIRDYGPKPCEQWTEEEQKKMGPCRPRVLDLSKTAFAALAATSQGIIRVKVEPVVAGAGE